MFVLIPFLNLHSRILYEITGYGNVIDTLSLAGRQKHHAVLGERFHQRISAGICKIVVICKAAVQVTSEAETFRCVR